MSCEASRSMMLDALKSGQRLPELETHLEQCPTCATEFEELAQVWEALGALNAGIPAPTLGSDLKQRMSETRSPLRLWLAPGALVAGFLLAVGFGLGAVMRPLPASSLSRWGQDSVGTRLSGIALMSENSAGDPATVAALLDLVDTDPSVSVRLAAVDALYLMADSSLMGNRLAKSLRLQQDPTVQMALVDLMVALREKQAASSLRWLLREGRLTPELRRRVEGRMAELKL